MSKREDEARDLLARTLALLLVVEFKTDAHLELVRTFYKEIHDFLYPLPSKPGTTKPNVRKP